MDTVRMHPGLSALLEVGLMFLPAIPAYLWLWPAVIGEDLFHLVQSLVYLYFLAGCLVIGRRRWSPSQLGLNLQGFWLSLACGMLLIAAINLGRLATDLPMRLRPFSWQRLLWEVFFYFVLVGLIEELLFRGLIYRALVVWRGTRMAILGSALAFGFFHIGWAGTLSMLGIAFIGLVLAVIRWRAGGISGLILVHGLLDVLSVETYSGAAATGDLGVRVERPGLAILADLLILSVLLYLWKTRPQMQHQGA
jgi:membrane protease YdiL (CAAX protease family)